MKTEDEIKNKLNQLIEEKKTVTPHLEGIIISFEINLLQWVLGDSDE